MHDGIEIIDGHMHIMTSCFVERRKRRLESADAAHQKAHQSWYEGFIRKYNSDMGEDNTDPPEKIARDWAAELSGT